MFFSVDTAIGIVGLISTFGVWYFDIKKKLDQLVREQEGILNKQQATDLLNVYLMLVTSHLQDAFQRYIEKSLHQDLKKGSATKVLNELEDIYRGVVLNKIRPMVSNFRLRNGMLFGTFLNSATQEHVRQGFAQAEVLISAVDSGQETIEGALEKIRSAIRQANIKGGAIYKESIDKIYEKHDM